MGFAPESAKSKATRIISASEWTVGNRVTAHPMFGLCALNLYVHWDVHLEDASIDVRIGGRQALIPVRDALFSRIQGQEWAGLRIHIVSHLISNGPAHLQADIIFSDGERVALPGASYTIRNCGLLAESVRLDLVAHGTSAIFGKTVDSAFFPYEKGRTTAWFNAPAAIEETPLAFEPAKDVETARKHLSRWGFTILPEVLPRPIIDEFRAEVEIALAEERLKWRQGSSDRIHNSHRLPHGRKIWLFPPVLEFLRDWFRDEPCACQTLLYINGSQQGAHQDTIHLTPYPAGYMCGVWVPLEDVQPDSGELFVYPGSHRTQRLLAGPLGLEKVSTDYSTYTKFDGAVNAAVSAGGYKRQIYLPKAGQILVWHENLVHGGSRRIDPSITRWSIVSHYFARGSVAYYDSRGEAAALEQLD